MARQASLCSLLVLAFLLLTSSPQLAESAVTCGSVASDISHCITYVKGSGPLTPDCCSGMKSLAAAASTTADRRTACACHKSLVANIPGLNPDLAAGLLGKCGANVPFIIGTSIDCSNLWPQDVTIRRLSAGELSDAPAE